MAVESIKAPPRRKAAAHRPGTTRFEVVESKLRVPAAPPGAVSRTGLVNRLRATASVPVVALVAPAGYGKTTLLTQWAAREKRPLAWVTLDERDDDPLVLLRHVALALDRIEALDPSVFRPLRGRGRPVSNEALARVGAAFARLSQPVVLVLDDSHLVRSRDSTQALALLVDHVPDGSLLVLSGRVAPRLPLARLRAHGRLLELGAGELALTRREATLLLRNAGVQPGEGEVTELLRRTEGWAAALYLAVLSQRDGGKSDSQPALAFTGDDRTLADYFRSEYLSLLSRSELEFLRRTSILERMCGPLCDAVLEREGSARHLASIERSNLFLVPLDRRRDWYRYHHLFRELLRRELSEREPDLVPALHRRAADWFETQGDRESALEHASAADDTDRAADILGSIALSVCYRGEMSTVERWLGRFDDDARLERFPAVALHGSRVHSIRGRADEAERWLAAAERSKVRGPLPDGSPSARPWIALLRATMCRDGPERMLSDARRAVAGLPATSPWRPAALVLEGAAGLLLGDNDRAEALLVEATAAAERLGATEPLVVALSQRSLIAGERGDHDEAETLALQAHALVEEFRLDDYPTRAIELAASARVVLRHGRWDQARVHLSSARRLTPFLTTALPWLAVQVRLELARTCVALRDADGARGLFDEIEEIFRHRPNLGVLSEQVDALRAEIEAIPESANGQGRGLTTAELRLLPLLATHLSFREIGERLYVSRNTVKTQAISVYRKLGVSSRSEAIEHAARLGLLATGG